MLKSLFRVFLGVYIFLGLFFSLWDARAENSGEKLISEIKTAKDYAHQKNIEDDAKNLGANAKTIFPQVLELALNDDYTISDNARKALKGFGSYSKDIIPQLIKVAVDSSDFDKMSRARLALAALAEMEIHAKIILALLLNELKHDDFHIRQEVRQEAASTIGELREYAKPVIPQLITILKDGEEDSDVRAAAALALGRIGQEPDKVVPILIQALANKNYKVKGGSAHALGYFPTYAKQTVPLLLNALSDKSVPVRQDVLYGLRQLGPLAKKASETVKKMLNDPNEYVRDAATDALAAIERSSKTTETSSEPSSESAETDFNNSSNPYWKESFTPEKKAAVAKMRKEEVVLLEESYKLRSKCDATYKYKSVTSDDLLITSAFKNIGYDVKGCMCQDKQSFQAHDKKALGFFKKYLDYQQAVKNKDISAQALKKFQTLDYDLCYAGGPYDLTVPKVTRGKSNFAVYHMVHEKNGEITEDSQSEILANENVLRLIALIKKKSGLMALMSRMDVDSILFGGFYLYNLDKPARTYASIFKNAMQCYEWGEYCMEGTMLGQMGVTEGLEEFQAIASQFLSIKVNVLEATHTDQRKNISGYPTRLSRLKIEMVSKAPLIGTSKSTMSFDIWHAQNARYVNYVPSFTQIIFKQDNEQVRSFYEKLGLVVQMTFTEEEKGVVTQKQTEDLVVAKNVKIHEGILDYPPKGYVLQTVESSREVSSDDGDSEEIDQGTDEKSEQKPEKKDNSKDQSKELLKEGAKKMFKGNWH